MIAGTRYRRRGALWVGTTITSLLLALASAGAEPPQDGTYLLTDVQIVPMDSDRVVEAGAVLVDQGVIRWMGKAPDAPDVGARVVSGGGAWLFPGLVDMHVHLRTEEELLLHLVNGVTTVANMHGTQGHLELRRRVASGSLDGPRIYTAGPTIDGDPPRDDEFVAVANAARGAAVVKEQADAGYDFLKIYDLITEEAYRGVLDEARKRRKAIAGHIPKSIGLEKILDGYDFIVHAEEYFYTFFGNEDDRNRLEGAAQLTARAGVTVCPNTGAIAMILQQVDDIEAVLARPEVDYLPFASTRRWFPEGNRYLGRSQEWRDGVRRMYPFLIRLTRALHAAGVRIVACTDAPAAAGVPGYALFNEMNELSKAGLSSFEVLRAATVNPGEWIAENLQPKHPTGMISPGYSADFLLVGGNPLADRTVLSRALRSVVIDGRWIDVSRIREELEERAARHRALLEPYLRFKTAIGIGDYERAERILESEANEVLSSSATNRLGYYYLYRLQAPDRALAVFEMNTRHAPTDANVWDSLGEALKTVRRWDEATAMYQRSLELDPGNQNAVRMLAEIDRMRRAE